MISTSNASPLSQLKQIRHWSFIRRLYCPERSPLSDSSLFPGTAANSSRSSTVLSRSSLTLARVCISCGRRREKPRFQICSASLFLNDLIMGIIVSRLDTPVKSKNGTVTFLKKHAGMINKCPSTSPKTAGGSPNTLCQVPRRRSANVSAAATKSKWRPGNGTMSAGGPDDASLSGVRSNGMGRVKRVGNGNAVYRATYDLPSPRLVALPSPRQTIEMGNVLS